LYRRGRTPAPVAAPHDSAAAGQPTGTPAHHPVVVTRRGEDHDAADTARPNTSRLTHCAPPPGVIAFRAVERRIRQRGRRGTSSSIEERVGPAASSMRVTAEREASAVIRFWIRRATRPGRASARTAQSRFSRSIWQRGHEHRGAAPTIEARCECVAREYDEAALGWSVNPPRISPTRARIVFEGIA
jgi:hypothetical protein